LSGIQRNIQQRRGDRGLKILESKLNKELSDVLTQEERLWFQRSRAKWLSDGDRNTKYYHLKTVNRRRKNKILMLRDGNGVWIEDVELIKNMVNNYYLELFTVREQSTTWIQTRVSFPPLSPSMQTSLSAEVSDAEVQQAVFSMGAWKAPGPDGYPAGFYQNSWEVVGKSTCDFVRKVWMRPDTLEEINVTDICLIPKVDKPEFVNQFRPISLCNNLYKIISKILVNRLKELMHTLISPYQTGFIQGRCIHENIVVAQEMIHSMNRTTGKVGYFVIKVDLTKAYDMLDWCFVMKVLNEIKLPDSIINIIYHAVTSVRTNVKWNGDRANYFRPQRGIRQGDPISPYLFVLCMDKLSHLIMEEVDKGEWKTMRAGRHGPVISHLMFADDLLLFGQATVKQMECVMRTLNLFCSMSGQQVSMEKTSVLFSKNINRSTRQELLNISGFRETMQLGKYLGVPITGKAPKRSDFQYLIDQVSSKLTAWKAKHMSFAGRVTLAKSVIEAIPVYPMMNSTIPVGCLNEIQKIQRAFIWGDDTYKRKIHAVRWEKVTQPKALGGLGLRNLQIMNSACLMKLGWELRSGNEALWCRVIRGKYERVNIANDTIIVKAYDSSLWKAIVKLWPNFIQFQYCSVGDGLNTNAWSTCWVKEGYRIDSMLDEVPAVWRDAKVADLVDHEGKWPVEDLQWLPSHIRDNIRAIVPPAADMGNDVCLWPGNSNGKFTVSSAYRLMCMECEEDDSQREEWSKVWKLEVHERVRCFIWMARHGRLLTNQMKHNMRLGEPYCHRCSMQIESLLHVLRDCPLARVVWIHLVPMNLRRNFFDMGWQQWFDTNSRNEVEDLNNIRWNAMWAMTCHNLWQWRNKETHDSNVVRPPEAWNHIRKMVCDYKKRRRQRITWCNVIQFSVWCIGRLHHQAGLN
jgi:hypothetical protein